MTDTTDPYDLERFVTAQRGVYQIALEELRRGAKRSHWMWFIFPQVAGLGSSSMAARYSIRSWAEGANYLAHPLLGPRLLSCASALLQIEGLTAKEVLGHPDDIKLKSSMTLFAAVSPPGSPFQKVLELYFDGSTDPKTVNYLRARPAC